MPLFHTIERKALRAQVQAHDTLPDLNNWFPVTLTHEQIIWRHVAGRFISPFFGDTLDQQAPSERRVCLTPMPSPSALLTRHLQQLPCIAPSAFVFHISRCGSTLLSQCLCSLPQCIVLSEPPIIDACLRKDWAETQQQPEARLRLLRQMILALGQRRHPDETHVIIKLDSWHIAYLPLLRAAFPETPCWFLYREPQAVLASHQRQRGPQMVPGMVFPARLEQPDDDSAPLAPGDLDGYCVQVLAWMFRHALGHADQLHWLNYSQLPDALWQTFLPQLGVHCDEQQIAAMSTRARFHAKRVGDTFSADPAPSGAHEQASAPTSAQQALHDVILPLYQQIEHLRRSGSESCVCHT